MTNYIELKELITFLRKNGVMEYDTPNLSLVLGDEPSEVVDTVDKEDKPKQNRRGRDGLTGEEQEELYNRRIDGE